MASESGRGSAEPHALLVDIGNTRIKWALWHEGRLGRMQAAAFADWSSRDYERRLSRGLRSAPDRILVSSVAGVRIETLLRAAARRAGWPAPQFARTARRAAGVVTRYTEPWRLGVDRFMGVIAAHHLASTRGVCVVNVGTAVTLDLVDGRGTHLGGAILPGPRLMVESLLDGTAGIAKRARGGGGGRRAGAVDLFARNTAAAVEHGALHAVAAAIDLAAANAGDTLAEAPLVLLTGGGVGEVDRLVRHQHLVVPDLVLRGVALHAGLAVR
jgi:type III pantothenate kinase